ncbi:TlpA family protein disulfide reductase [Paenibacillus sp. GCM10012306]|uniref:TlpA family protein disulfide reductase n=1 Tax=Paenibacillus sp. GCM10012306 TaxID=3317342 RepID=UPI00360BAEC2
MKAVNKRNLAVVALIVILGVLVMWRERGSEAVAVFNSQELPTESGPRAGLLAPALSLQGSDGSTYQVGGKREKAVMLNFWASWCDPCQQEAPELNVIAQKYKDKLDIYGINVTSHDYKPNAERFVKKFKLTFPVMYDLKGEAFAKFNGAVFPTNVLIDKNGVISEIILGILTPEELEAKIVTLTGS